MLEFLKDLWDFMRERKKYWLVPIILMLVALSVLLALTHTVVGPFLYSFI